MCMYVHVHYYVHVHTCIYTCVAILHVHVHVYTCTCSILWFLCPDCGRCCGDGGSYGEMLLLIAIHLREKQLPQLEELISSTLNMKISVRDVQTCHLQSNVSPA